MTEWPQGGAPLSRRRALKGAAGTLACARAAQAQDGLRDLAGQRLRPTQPARRLVLGDGRMIYALALLGGAELLRRIVGWQNDFPLLAPASHAAFTAAFPFLRDVVPIGQTSEQSVSVERILDLRPDLAIFGLIGHGPLPGGPVHQQLEAAGVAVAFVDFALRPLDNTASSICLLGDLLGYPDRAAGYATWFQARVARVRQRVEALRASTPPTAFIELLPLVWPSPGHTAGRGSMADLIEAAGGRNIAAHKLPGAFGEISQEYLLTAQPDVYIATGNRPPGIVLGPGATGATASSGLSRVLDRPVVQALRAVATGRAHALWHDFHDLPFTAVALEAIARWLWPGRLDDIDPGASWPELHARFMPIPEHGTYWLDAPAPART